MFSIFPLKLDILAKLTILRIEFGGFESLVQAFTASRAMSMLAVVFMRSMVSMSLIATSVVGPLLWIPAQFIIIEGLCVVMTF